MQEILRPRRHDDDAKFEIESCIDARRWIREIGSLNQELF
jgi:hypothetical protein